MMIGARIIHRDTKRVLIYLFIFSFLAHPSPTLAMIRMFVICRRQFGFEAPNLFTPLIVPRMTREFAVVFEELPLLTAVNLGAPQLGFHGCLGPGCILGSVLSGAQLVSEVVPDGPHIV